MRKNIEALIFVSESPLKIDRIAEIVEAKKGEVKKCLEALQAEYLGADRGIILEEVGEGFQFRSRPECSEVIQQLVKNRPFRFSRAALRRWRLSPTDSR